MTRANEVCILNKLHDIFIEAELKGFLCVRINPFTAVHAWMPYVEQ